jgi:ribosome maturation factor RimP
VPDDLAKRLEPIVADAVNTVGFDLDDLDVQQAGRRKVVKVVVDSDEGVALDEVATVSRAVSSELDKHDHVILGAYTLEVTSPGLGRPLTKRRHWRRARYRLVRVTPRDGEEFVGRVGFAGEKAARILVGSQIKDVRYASVAKAVVEIEFKQPPHAELKRLREDEAREAKSGHTGDSTTETEEPR